MPRKVIHAGIESFGAGWCTDFLAQHMEDGTIEVVAAVDIDPSRLVIAREHLGLREDQCWATKNYPLSM